MSHKAVRLLFIISTVIVILSVIISLCDNDETINVPITYSSDYYEDEQGYAVQFKSSYDWENIEPTPDETQYVFTTVDKSAVNFSTYKKDVTVTSLHYQSSYDIELASMSENDMWYLVSNGVFNEYPKSAYRDIKDRVETVKNTSTCTVTVKCWYWADPKDNTNMDKVSVTKTFAVNAAIADMFQHIFEDIYAHPSKPVINIADTGMGTWVLRGKNHSNTNTLSAHSMGTAIDINPSTGSFYINGCWYGNAYNQHAMPTQLWVQLPDSHKKYHVLYADSPIVQIFKSYGWYWGGDWTSGIDPMHLAFLGDGANARQIGYTNYLKGR